MRNPLSFLLRRRNEKRALSSGVPGTLANPTSGLERLLLGNSAGDTVSGVEINETNAMSISTVFACIRAISEDVAKLPLVVYRQEEKGRTRLRGHRLYDLLHNAPNEEMSSFDFRSTLTGHVLGHGNGRAEIVRLGNGIPVELWPMEPDRTRVSRSSRTGQIVYEYRNPRSGKTVTLPAADVLDVRGLGYDGIVGYSIIGWARESLSMTAAAERFGGSFFGNSSLPRGILEHPGTLGQTAADNLRESWEKVYKGPKNANKVGILEEGMTFKALTINPEDAQFLETRQFQVPEVCRWFRMPPHKVADLSRATFSNIEHSSLEYVSDTLMPWFVRWEQEIKRKLFMSTEKSNYVEHLTAALLRGDLKSRYEAYGVGRQWGFLSANDIRAKENENTVDGGDVYLVPINMQNAKIPEKQTEPPDPAKATPPANDKNDDGKNEDDKNEDGKNSFRELFVSAFARLGRIESEKVGRNAKRENRSEWVGEFVSEFRSVIVREIAPIVTAIYGVESMVLNEDRSVAEARVEGFEIARRVAAEWSSRTLEILSPGWEENLPATLAKWDDRPSEDGSRCYEVAVGLIRKRLESSK